jgi:hypothetical protein
MTYKPARLKSRCLPQQFRFREALLIHLIRKLPEHGIIITLKCILKEEGNLFTSDNSGVGIWKFSYPRHLASANKQGHISRGIFRCTEDLKRNLMYGI